MSSRKRENKGKRDKFELTPHRLMKDLQNKGCLDNCFVYYGFRDRPGRIELFWQTAPIERYRVLKNDFQIPVGKEYKYITHLASAKGFNQSNAKEMYKRMYIEDPINKTKKFTNSLLKGTVDKKIRKSFYKIREWVSNENNKIINDRYNELLKNFSILIKKRREEQELVEDDYEDEEEEEDEDEDAREKRAEMADLIAFPFMEQATDEEKEEDRKLKKNLKRINNWISQGTISKEEGEKMRNEQLRQLLE